MLATSPSPNIRPASAYSPYRYESSRKHSSSRPPLTPDDPSRTQQRQQQHPPAPPATPPPPHHQQHHHHHHHHHHHPHPPHHHQRNHPQQPFSSNISNYKDKSVSTTSLEEHHRPRAMMVDAGTQYSPTEPQSILQAHSYSPPEQRQATEPQQTISPATSTKTPTSTIAGLQLAEKDDPLDKSDSDSIGDSGSAAAESVATPANLEDISRAETGRTQSQPKRQAADPGLERPTNGVETSDDRLAPHSSSKKARPDAPPTRLMPLQYENCNTRDLVILISSMLMELIRYNDAIPLREGHLTRFHSRAPPGISVLDYLQRLTTHATLSPPILLSMVYYIDRLCALYPAFTISSLTVHRFLITSATVASKGLSDSFWTNKTYARVGGVSMKELALLELEFLTRMEWRIVPKPEVLCEYYNSLIERNSQYEMGR